MQLMKTSEHRKQHMKERNLEWYKTLEPGEVFYDVSNRTIRKHTFVGYFQDHQSLWIVRDSGGLTRLHDRMYPHHEYDIMVERIKVVEKMKIEAQIKALKTKLSSWENQLESDIELETLDFTDGSWENQLESDIELETLDFTDGSGEQPFASELDHTVHLIREIHNDGNLVQTNIDFKNPPKRPVGIKSVKDGL